MTIDIRPSPIAGQWYPGQPGRLAEMIDSMLDAAIIPDIPDRVVGLMVPHAGIIYSGHIAAHAFKLVRSLNVDRVIIVSPMHHSYPSPVLTTAHHAYETPLGVIPVDHSFLDKLRKYIPVTGIRNDPEHSLEIELPFLQRVIENTFTLVPLMMRDQTIKTASLLGTALADCLGGEESTLLVASSDLSHFYSAHKAHRLDRYMLDQVESMSPEQVIEADEMGKAFACGRGAIAAVMIGSKMLGADRASMIKYGTSADTSGDDQRVVGYAAAVFTGPLREK